MKNHHSSHGNKIASRLLITVVLAGAAPDWLPAGTSLRSVLLWLVLGLGVLVLGVVAFSMMRQLAARR